MKMFKLDNEFYKNQQEKNFETGYKNYSDLGLGGDTLAFDLIRKLNENDRIASKEKGILYAYSIKKLEQSVYNLNINYAEPLEILKKIGMLKDSNVKEILGKFGSPRKEVVQEYINKIKDIS